MKLLHIFPHKFIFLFLILCSFAYILPAQSLVIYGLQNDNPQNPNQSDFQLVQVNPFNGSTVALYTLPNTFAVIGGGSTYDPILKRFHFWGLDDNNAYTYFSASTGTPDLITNGINNFTPSELQYDLQTGITYGLEWDQTTSTEYLMSIDPQTGLPVDSMPLAGVAAKAVWSSGYNSNHHRFFFVGIDNANVLRFYYIDAQTGQIVHQPQIARSPQFLALQYDLTTDQVIALEVQIDPTKPQQGGLDYRELWVSNVDTVTGLSTPISSAPIWEGYEWGIQGGFTDFDQQTETFMFLVVDPDSGGRRLNLVDVNNGQLISTTPFPDLIFEIECDNLVFARTAYSNAPTSVREIAQTELQLYPNPTNGQFVLELPEGVQAERISVFDVQGREVAFSQIQQSPSDVVLKLEPTASGVYQVQVQTQAGELLVKKLILE
ncbi:MAG: T9SS type A sorting domain-containing protein [Bacteroidota bacterium]